MTLKLHIGNIGSETTQKDLNDLFASHGPVADVKIVTGLSRGRQRRFAFVTMGTEAAAMAAVEALNGELFGGAFITVGKAREHEEALADSSRTERSPRTSFSKLF